MNSVVILFAAFIAAACAAPQSLAPAVSRFETRDDAGQFSLQYQTVDGTVFTEQGALKRTPDGTDNVLVKQGSYRYISPEGVPIHVTYTADESGYRAEGEAIPVAPVVPQTTF